MEFHPGIIPPRRQRQRERRARLRRQRQRERRRRTLEPVQGPSEYVWRLETRPFFSLIADAPPIQQFIRYCIQEKYISAAEYLSSYAKIQTMSPPDATAAFRQGLGFKLPTPFLDHLQTTFEWGLTWQRRKFAFQRFLLRWKWKRYQRILNDVDPCTLAPPVKPVTVMDMKARGTYVFEMSSLAAFFQQQLSYDDWLFPTPQEPKNPLTNEPFTFGQLVAITRQLRTYQKTSWQLEAYIQMGKQMFKTQFHKPLRVCAVHTMHRNRTAEMTQDLFEEFLEDMFHDYAPKKQQFHVNTIVWLFARQIEDLYIEHWYKLFKRWQLLETFEESDGRWETREDVIRTEAKALALDTASQDRLFSKKTDAITGLLSGLSLS